MRAGLSWSPEAVQDLMDIYTMIGADNEAAAERWYSRVDEQVELLAEQPRLGVRRPDISPSARVLVEGVYLILYRIFPDTHIGPVDEVEVVGIVDGRRDFRISF
jgi:toxin ParE1/3/4